MKKFHSILFALIIVFTTLQSGYTQNPEYILNATNFSYFINKIEFDIYISHTNPSVDFEYAGGQYYFNFNPGIANGGVLTYSIIGSDLPASLRPRGPAVYNSQLRLAVNSFPGASLGYIMTGNGTPGTKIVKMRLQTSAASLSGDLLNIEWRNPPVPPQTNPVTKVYAYVGTENTNITSPATHLIGGMFSPPQLISPINNSENNELSLNILWNKVINATSYRMQISTDSLFNSIVVNDSVFNDTSKFISGLLPVTNYFIRLKAMNASASTVYSQSWKFKTRDVIKLKLTALIEGMYYPIFNLLSRRDTVKVYLAQTSPPYAKIDSAFSVIDSINFKGQYSFVNSPPGSYYLVAKHFNSLETWSKNGGENLIATDTNNFDFTSSLTQAYGNNMQLKGGKATFYSGDINNTGTIDGPDLIRIHTDATNFVSGYRLNTDLTGDNFVDGIDYSIGDNNAFSFVITISP